MPLRDYACTDCGHRFEHLERSSQRRKPRCPSCGSRNLAVAHSGFAVAQATSNPSPDRTPCGHCGSPAGSGSCAVPEA